MLTVTKVTGPMRPGLLGTIRFPGDDVPFVK